MSNIPYFRELQRYSQDEILQKLQLANEVGEKAFRYLLHNGVLKLRKDNEDGGNEAEDSQESMSTAELDNPETTVPSSAQRYVFDYVGAVEFDVDAHNILLLCYPKVFDNNFEARKDKTDTMKTVFSALRKYNAEKHAISIVNESDGKSTYNQLAIMLYLLQDYFDHGIYSNQRDVLVHLGQGEIDWNVTINETFPILQNGRPYYVDYYTNETEVDESGYITRLHQCILTECSQHLEHNGLKDFFDIETAELYDGTLDEFGEPEYIEQRILKELNVQFVTQKQQTLRCLYAFISRKENPTENSGISMFGTNSFNLVWEEACAKVFGSQLDTHIGKLGIRLNGVWKDKAGETLRDIIEKPVWWHYETNTIEKKDTLKPDFVAVVKSEEGDYYFVILDAKYYKVTIQDGKFKGIPGVGDVDKQQLYELAYKEFITDHGLIPANAFLFPSNESEDTKICNLIGEAYMPILKKRDLRPVFLIFLSMTEMLKLYVSGANRQVAEQLKDLLDKCKALHGEKAGDGQEAKEDGESTEIIEFNPIPKAAHAPEQIPDDSDWGNDHG